jgi:hypothetical protein
MRRPKSISAFLALMVTTVLWTTAASPAHARIAQEYVCDITGAMTESPPGSGTYQVQPMSWDCSASSDTDLGFAVLRMDAATTATLSVKGLANCDTTWTFADPTVLAATTVAGDSSFTSALSSSSLGFTVTSNTCGAIQTLDFTSVVGSGLASIDPTPGGYQLAASATILLP